MRTHHRRLLNATLQAYVRCLLAMLVALSPLLPVGAQHAAAIAVPNTGAEFSTLPLSFVPDFQDLQTPAAFAAYGPGVQINFTPAEVLFRLSMPTTVPSELASAERLAGEAQVRLLFIEANRSHALVGREVRSGVANFVRGNIPDKWLTSVPTYGEVRYENLYPGISLDYRGDSGALKGTYTVQPGADPGQIRWRYEGVQHLLVDSTSHDLRILLPGENGEISHRELRDAAPVAWQLVDGRSIPVSVDYAVSADASVAFEVGEYDQRFPLIIDPELRYSTFLGGSLEDAGLSMALDKDGNAYVTGYTLSTNFPVQNALDATHGGDRDLFVAKLNADGTAYDYVTYLGGTKEDQGKAIAVDSLGNAYIGGSTKSADFPVSGALQATMPSTGSSGFVTKLSPDGNLIFSTYLGGTGNASVNGITVDIDRYIYVVGLASNIGFPQVNPFGAGDAFISKFEPSGNALVYSTFIGPTGSGGAQGVAVDWEGNAYVTGITYSEAFVTLNPYQTACVPAVAGPCGGDAWAVKINRYGSGLLYATFLGGHGFDAGQGIAVDVDGTAVIVGTTTASDFPTTPGVFQPSYGGGRSDIFVTRLNAQGNGLIYSTYLGGNADENMSGARAAIALDAVGNATVVGNTASTNFPAVEALKASNRAGDTDGFVTKLSPSGNAIFSTYLGSSKAADGVYGVAIDQNDDIYVTGSTRSNDFPLLNPLQGSNAGGMSDVFLTKMSHGDGSGVRIDPLHVVFGTQPYRIWSSLQSVQLRNTGATELTIASIELVGTHAQDFNVQAGGCTRAPLQPGASCWIGTSFMPNGTGLRYARLVVTSPSWPAPRSVMLRGRGAPTSSVRPDRLVFPTTKRNTYSEPLYIALYNVGQEPLQLSTVTIGGLHADEFFIFSDECSNTAVLGDASCEVGVRFYPKQDGDRFGRLEFASLDFAEPVQAPLQGTGGATPDVTIEGLDSGICIGTLLTVRGSNFPRRMPTGEGTYQIFFDDILAGGGTTDDYGNLSTRIRVPTYRGSVHTITVVDTKIPTAKVTVPIDVPVLRNDLPVIIIPGVSGSYLDAASHFAYVAPPDPALALPIPDTRQLLPATFGYPPGTHIWLDGWGVAAIFTGGYRVIDAIQLQPDGVTPKPDMVGTVPDLRVGDIIWDLDIGIDKKDIYAILRDTIQTQKNSDGTPRYRDSGPERTLYYFPYDWRKDIALTTTPLENLINQALATSGKDKVVIIAHSMGGLVARNYLLRRGGTKVDQLITLATPYLGSTLVPNVLENGDDWGVGAHIGDFGVGMHPKEMKKIAPNFVATWELLPSNLYFNYDPLAPNFDPHFLIRSSLIDFVNYPEPLDHAASIAFLGNRYNAALSAQAEQFRNLGIGDFSLLTDQVFHQRIIGNSIPTIGRLVYSPRRICGTIPIVGGMLCADLPEFVAPRLDILGDGTVPLHSAMGANWSDDRYYIIPEVKHGPITSNLAALELVKDMLNGARCSNSDPPLNSELSAASVGSVAEATLDPETGVTGADILITGYADLDIYDGQGNHAGIIPGSGYQKEVDISGAQYLWLDGGRTASLTADGDYTLVVRGTETAGAASIRVSSMSGGETTQTIVFDSIAITGTSVATFTLSLPGPVVGQALAYQYDESTPVQQVGQLPVLTGAASADLTPPTTQITVDGSGLVTLIAHDGGEAGVRTIQYSTENPPSQYVTYEGPFQLAEGGSVTAFATDWAGNSEYPLAHHGPGIMPSIASFWANPLVIAPGETSTLAWNVSGATDLSINPDVGAVLGTLVAVSPTASTTYKLTASNATGSATAEVTVTVLAEADAANLFLPLLQR